MKRYRKKPVVIEAIQFTGENFAECCAFDAGVRVRHAQGLPRFLEVDTLEGDGLTAVPGDYIIRGIKGEVYPCKPDIFEETYEEVV